MPIISRMSAGVIIAAATIAAVVGCSNPGTPRSYGPSTATPQYTAASSRRIRCWPTPQRE